MVARSLMGTSPLPPHRQLIQNAVFIPEEDFYLKSTHVHDYISHLLHDETEVMLDGGLFYICRNVLPAGRVVEWSLYEDSPWDEICRKQLWGTFGKGGKGPLRFRPISTLELDHLIAIRDTQHYISPTIRLVVEHWIAVKSAGVAASLD